MGNEKRDISTRDLITWGEITIISGKRELGEESWVLETMNVPN